MWWFFLCLIIKTRFFKGRFPKYDNEIAIGAKYAKEKGFEIGNEIEIALNGNTQKYLISGFTQISNNLGRDCLLTRQGYERLGTLQSVTYYINLVEGTDIDAFNEEMKGKDRKWKWFVAGCQYDSPKLSGESNQGKGACNMTETRRMEDLSVAYLSAIAAQASVDFETLPWWALLKLLYFYQRYEKVFTNLYLIP